MRILVIIFVILLEEGDLIIAMLLIFKLVEFEFN